MQVLQFFSEVIPFLEENIHIGPRLSNHLLNLLQDEDQKKKLIMELAAVVDAGEPFVKATYLL